MCLRLFGTTGKPHPNAKILAYEILGEIESNGYELNC